MHVFFSLQVEFYFSDVNILKDAFLLKHVRRNKQGYVSLKLITSFKKVKTLTKDFRVVAFSLKQSDKLEVNEEETKVRRIEPLPEYDETTPSRTVVAVNLPYESPTIENVADLFKKCGDIALVRILRPGKSVPQDVKKHINKHPEIGTTVCAVVEFEAHEAAKKACDTMNNTDDWRKKDLRVVLLSTKQEKKENKKDRRKHGPGGDAQSGKSDKEEADKDDGRRRKKKNSKRKNSRVDEIQRSGSPYLSSGSDMESVDPSPSQKRNDSFGPGMNERPRANSLGPHSEGTGRLRADSLEPNPERRRSDYTQRSSLSPTDNNRLSPNVTPRSTPGNSPRNSPRGSPATRRKHPHGRSPLAKELSPASSPRNSPRHSPETQRRKKSWDSGGESGSSPSSPWVQRRLKAAQEMSPLAGNSPGASPLLGRRMAGVIREPKGPDGSKGFYDGKGRGKPLSPLAQNVAT